MPIALNVSATKDYVLKCDRTLPEEQQTKFTLGMLDVKERIKIEDDQAQYGISTSNKSPDAPADMRVLRHKRNYEVVKLGLVGWKDFKDENGKEIVFDTTAQTGGKNGSRNLVSDLCLSRLAMEWIDELADAIIGENKITAEESKNS